MERKGNIVLLDKMSYTQRVVEVAVGVERHYGTQVVVGDEFVKGVILAWGRASGVDDYALFGVVPHDVCVLAQRVYGETCYLYHGFVCFCAGFIKLQRYIIFVRKQILAPSKGEKVVGWRFLWCGE